LFTPPTRTSQNCHGLDKTVLSRQSRLVGGVNKPLVTNWKLGRVETKLIETGSWQDKRCEQAVRRTTNKKSHTPWSPPTKQCCFVMPLKYTEQLRLWLYVCRQKGTSSSAMAETAGRF